MCLIKVFCVIYFTALCASLDSEDDSPVLYLHILSEWVKVFPSEKVVFNCSISDTFDWNIIWQRDADELQDAGPNVFVSDEGSVLTITAATQMAGNYSCKGRHKTNGNTTESSNVIAIDIYEKNPKVTVKRTPDFDRIFPGETVIFKCTVDVLSAWEYVWSYNGVEIQATAGDTYVIKSIARSNSGQYQCKAKRGKDPFYTEDGKTSLQVSDPPTPSMKLVSSWLDVFKEETVTFSCEVDDSHWMYTWYKNEQELPDENDSFLNITSVMQMNEGYYACKAQLPSRNVKSGFSNRMNVIVYENTPEPTVIKAPDFNPMYVNETVNFTCTVNVSSGWSYQWYKDGNELSPSVTSKTLSIPLSFSDGANYSCKATRSKKTFTSHSAEISQDVREIPVPTLKNMTQWLDVFPTESVMLSCGMDDDSDWKYTWYKDGQKVKPDNTVSFNLNGATLSISSASDKNSGQYRCMGQLQDRSVDSIFSSEVTLTVYDKKPSVILTQDPEYKVMFPGESVTFSCHINVSSGWEYLWYKDGNELGVSENKYSVNPVETGTRSYKCKAKRGRSQVFFTDSSQLIRLNVEAKKPKPLVTREPDLDRLYVGELVFFKCEIASSSGWEYHWYKDGAVLSYNSSFTIHHASSSDNGLYHCMAKRIKTMYSAEHSDKLVLQISEIPVPTLKNKVQWLDVFPTESVMLSCGMDDDSDWKYTWYKDGEKVKPDNTVSFDSDQTTLSISSASASHHGKYNCLGKLKSRSVNSTFSSGLTLSVHDTKPRVTLMRNPKCDVLHTEDPVLFSCHVNVSSGWEYLWYKDGTALTESGNIYNISSAVIENTGSYTCQVKRGTDHVFYSNQSQAVKLNINERPQAHIMLLTGWSEAFSTDTLVLQCVVQDSQDKWNYTWLQDTKQIDILSERHKVTPQDDPDQSPYTCYGTRVGRPFYSKQSDSYKTKNLLLKRRVLLSISGCIFFGLIAVFLGCIALRVFHKPDDDNDKPEEENLFLTMAQMKDRTDVPCPLVDYITDAALNEPPKEGDENCNETTPLPITTQEDQAEKTESHDTEENNGGLVSFKQ